MFLRLRWDQARVALSRRVGHDGAKEIARTMTNGWRLGPVGPRKAVHPDMRRRATASF